MLNKLINKLAILAAKWCVKTDRVFFITGGPKGKETTYLIRYILFKSRFGCIYIHRFMRSDADDPHDHPWNFWTYVISGGYREVFYDKSKPKKLKTKFKSLWSREIRVRKPGSIAYRRATDIHQVVVDRPYDMHEVHLAPFTICLMGPRLREWGFWVDSGKFVDWRTYLKVNPNDPRIEGSE